MSVSRIPDDVGETVARALAEDVGTGDLTAALIGAAGTAHAHIIAREPGILAGTPWGNETFRRVDSGIKASWRKSDGDPLAADDILCDINGPARGILSAERTALNFLQTLSGTATEARRYADAVRGTGATVIDTRKTLPGLRRAQKYAVAVGGCGNHRMGLYDFILIKENHIAAAGSIEAALAAARAQRAVVPIEIEVETLGELEEALAAGAERILLDNFDPTGLREAVRITAGRAKLEASGNVEFDAVRAIAETGVDFISTGALTKHVRALDLSLRFVPSPDL
ncbi:MAG: carboxylating nicotinate-nucleotide diphosphorylase [Gammaproteobacteria bacterium]|nr:carboxylating nicotinate-nucleotide diphosphorylase [Gammaproteobacteria bacterium]